MEMSLSLAYCEAIRKAARSADYLRCVGSNSTTRAAERVEHLKKIGLEGWITELRQEWRDAGMEPPEWLTIYVNGKPVA